jgi:hypothetical protein
VIIEIPSTGERAEAYIVEDDPAVPLTVTFGRTRPAWYRLAPMVALGWRVVEASPRERAVLAAHASWFRSGDHRVAAGVSKLRPEA